LLIAVYVAVTPAPLKIEGADRPKTLETTKGMKLVEVTAEKKVELSVKQAIDAQDLRLVHQIVFFKLHR